MKYYTPINRQLDLDLFRSSLNELDKHNRWVMLGDSLPWSALEREYNSRLDNREKGAGNKPARMVISALIIKHKLNLGDEETIEIIRENPYMQYMCGLSEFTDKPIFDPSLFVTIRKRISIDDINSLTLRLMEEERHRKQDGSKDDNPPVAQQSDGDAAEFTDGKGRLHKGVLKIDATCADAEVRYPVDVDLLHDGCRKIHDYMTEVCKRFGLGKSRSCYKDARRSYLSLIKTAKKKGRMVKDTMERLLGYLRKDLHRLLELFAVDENRYEMFSQSDRKVLTAIIRMYHQQVWMLKTGTHHCADRIVSIFQPHVRPIVRGKAKARVEFGAKIGASIVDGYTFIDHFSWDAYNECNDMTLQIQLFKERFGYLPATIFADKIYINKANRAMLNDLEIKSYCKPLGRPPKDPPPENAISAREAAGKRNEIECSFGTGKRIYRADNIRAKLPDTADCWTGMCYFVKNVMKFLKGLCHALAEIRLLIICIVTRTRCVCTPAVVNDM